MAIGYRPMAVPIPADGDSVSVEAQVREPRPHSPVSWVRYPLNAAERRAIWTALLAGLTGATDDHMEVVSAVTGNRLAAPTGPIRVVLHLPGSPKNGELDDPQWHDSLIHERIIAGVCRLRRALDCPQEGHLLFVNPGPPAPYAHDSVLVGVWFTAADPGLCRRAHAMYDEGGESHFVIRVNDIWRYDGEDDGAVSTVGGGYCGPPDDRAIGRPN